MVDVVFTPEKIKRFKAAYASAFAGNKEQFTFDGQEYLTAYAKYLLEYLEQETKSL